MSASSWNPSLSSARRGKLVVKNSSHNAATGSVVVGQYVGESPAVTYECMLIRFHRPHQHRWVMYVEDLVALGCSNEGFGDAFPVGCIAVEMHTVNQYNIWNREIICLLTLQSQQP